LRAEHHLAWRVRPDAPHAVIGPIEERHSRRRGPAPWHQLVIWVLIGWQFTLAEFVGGLVLILVMTQLLRLFVSRRLEEQAGAHAVQADAGHEHHTAEVPLTLRQRVVSLDAWSQVASNFRNDWAMVWKEITIGFFLAGFIGLLRSCAAGMSSRLASNEYGAKPTTATRVPATLRTVISPGRPVWATPARFKGGRHRADAPRDFTMTIYDATQHVTSVDFLPRSGALKADHRPSSCSDAPKQYPNRDEPARLGAVNY
jgi:hypothetical protein